MQFNAGKPLNSTQICLILVSAKQFLQCLQLSAIVSVGPANIKSILSLSLKQFKPKRGRYPSNVVTFSMQVAWYDWYEPPIPSSAALRTTSTEHLMLKNSGQLGGT